MSENASSLEGMSGILYSPDSVINSLRHLLNETYKDENGGITLIKEILQNADDAGATEVTITQVPATEEPCDNPLLRRAGIIIANNGAFADDNRKAFLTFSDSDKTQESGKVGRFGLGRFSLFHRTEAIFYWGSDGNKVHTGCFSPWIHDGKDYARLSAEDSKTDAAHVGWDAWDGTTRNFLYSRIRSVTPWLTDTPTKGFAIFLPSREHGDAPILVNRIRLEVSELINIEMERTHYPLASMMPQLRSVEKLLIHRIHAGHAHSAAASDLKVTRTPGAGLTRPHADEPNPPDRDSHGVIEVEIGSTGSKNRRSFTYRILERAADPEGVFASLKKQSDWPKITSALKTVDQKSQHHGAVTAITNFKGKGLHIRLAVFLPLHEKADFTDNDEPAVQLTLHGYFFLDSGRKEIKFDGEQTANDWNRQILGRLTLPSVIPSLTSALNKLDWETQKAIVGSLPAKFKTVLGDRGAPPSWRIAEDLLSRITEDHQLVTGPAWNGEFKSIGAGIPCVAVLRPETASLLEPLRDIAKSMFDTHKVCLVWQGEPGLRPASAKEDWGNLSGTAAAKRFEILLTPVIEKSDDPSCWLPILLEQILGRKLPPEHGKALLLQIFRKTAEQSDPASSLTLDPAQREGMQEACKKCDIRLIFGTGDAVRFACGHPDALKDADIIFVTCDTLKKMPDERKPEPMEPILQFLRAIPKESLSIQKDGKEMVLPGWVALFKSILNNLSPEEKAQLQTDEKISALPILRARNGKNAEDWLSLTKLNSLRSKFRIFVQQSKHDESITLLLNALKNPEEVWFTESSLPGPALSPLDGRAYCKLLRNGMYPAAAEKTREKAAIEMIKAYKRPDNDAELEFKFALAALLRYPGWNHAALTNNDSQPIVVSDDDCKTAKTMGFEDWRLVPEALVAEIKSRTNDTERENTPWGRGVVPQFTSSLDGKAISAHIDRRGAQSVFQNLTREQREDLAARLLQSDKSIFGYPVFEAEGTDGPWVSLEDHGLNLVYREEGRELNLPECLEGKVRFVKRPVDNKVRKHIRQWGPLPMLELGLKHCQAAAVFRAIEIAVTDTGDPKREDTLNDYLETIKKNTSAWIPLRGELYDISSIWDPKPDLVASLDVLLGERRKSELSCLADVENLPDALKGKELGRRAEGRFWEFVLSELMQNRPPKLFPAGMAEDVCREILHWFAKQEPGDGELENLWLRPAIAFCRVAATCGEPLSPDWLKCVTDDASNFDFRPVFRWVTNPVLQKSLTAAHRRWLLALLPEAEPEVLRKWVEDERVVPTRDGGWNRSNSVTASDDMGIHEKYRLHDDWASKFQAPNHGQPRTPVADVIRKLKDSGYVSKDLILNLIAILAIPLVKEKNLIEGALDEEKNLIEELVGMEEKDLRDRMVKVMRAAEWDERLQVTYRDLSKKAVEFFPSTGDPKSLTGTPITPTRESRSRLKDISAFELPQLSNTDLKGYNLKISLWDFPSDQTAADCVKDTIIAILAAVASKVGGMGSTSSNIINKKGIHDLLAKDMECNADIRVARSILSRGLARTLRQLRAGEKSPEIDKSVSTVLAAELRHASALQGPSLPLASLDRRWKDVIDSLQDLTTQVERNSGIVIDALRQHLNMLNYHAKQTIFELFQNADDALQQLPDRQEIEPGIIVISEDRKITFEHSGRKINSPGIGGNAEDSASWKRDIINMLDFGISEKRTESTGRFGLGFKSVYLLTDKPEIYSGHLSFRVVGGLLPAELPKTNDNLGGGSISSTRFVLPLRDAISDGQASNCFDEFVRLAPLLVLFAQRATRILCKKGDREPVEFELGRQRKNLVCEGHDCALSFSTTDFADGSGWLFVRPLNEKSGPRLQVVFRLKHGRFDIPDEKVPRVWVTVPTQELVEDLGFVMGGPFAVDVGRSRLLFDQPVTQEALAQLSSLLVAAVKVIFNKDADLYEWPDGIEIQTLRASLFLALTANLRKTTDSGQSSWHEQFVCKTLGDDRLQNVPLIPDQHGNVHPRSGLKRLHSLLAQLAAQREDFRAWLNTSAVPLDAKVCERLARLEKTERGVSTEDFAVTVRKSAGDEPFLESPEQRQLHLSALTILFNFGLPDNPVELLDWVGNRRVSTVGGVCKLMEVYIPEDANPEESADHELVKLRIVTRIAPKDRLLDNTQYREELKTELLPAFRKHRPWSLNPDEIIEWVAEGKLTTDDQRLALAELLVLLQVDNKLQTAMQDHAKRPGWLNEALMNKAGGALKNQGVGVTDQHIGAAVYGCGIRMYERTVEAAPELLHPWRLLKQWWDDEKNAAEGRRYYFGKVYAGAWPGSQEELVTALKDPSDPEHMKAWMTMFLIAMSFRLGRVTEDQSREFVRRSAHWLELASDPNPAPEAWMNGLDRALGDVQGSDAARDRYFEWLQLFPSFRAAWWRSRNWIELAHNSAPQMIDPFEILGPNFSAGSGFGASRPLNKVLGRIGSVWLCRELVRLGLWNAEGRKYHFYVPWKFHTLSLLGLSEKPRPSAPEITKAIEDLLGERPFGNDFDLPAQLLKMRYGLLWDDVYKKLTSSSKERLEGQSEIEDAEPAESEPE